MTESTFISEKNFIVATRDVGYLNTTMAVAELVDNAIQAKATRIDLILRHDLFRGERSLAVAVLDNGSGMKASVLRSALRFGGSTRFNNRKGLGRFGMGLPNSALSQCKRLEVYSWQKHRGPLFTHLDVDEILAGEMGEVPPPRRRALPELLRSQMGVSGTLVVWRKCDRLSNKRPHALIARLILDTGRLYRHFLWAGISVTVNGAKVTPQDPLFERIPDRSRSASVFGQELEWEIRVPGSSVKTSAVRVRFTLLPVSLLAQLPTELKHSLRVIGHAGASIVRAGREIASGWYFMGSKRRENYDDWWRCEIRFDPELDELFGVSNSKQGIKPTSDLISILSPSIESTARLLNSKVRERFLEIAENGEHGGRLNGDAVETAGAAEDRLPPIQTDRAGPGVGSPATREICNLRYRITYRPLRSPSFFKVKLVEKTIVLSLNTNHPFFLRIYRPACESSESERFHIECLLLAAARAEVASSVNLSARETVQGLRESWSDALFSFLKAP